MDNQMPTLGEKEDQYQSLDRRMQQVSEKKELFSSLLQKGGHEYPSVFELDNTGIPDWVRRQLIGKSK